MTDAGHLLAAYDYNARRASMITAEARDAWEHDQPMHAAHLVATAQVHATLADAAATVLLAHTVAGDIAA